MVKIDRNLSLGIKKANNEFKLVDVNFSFKNNDVFEIYDIGLRIDVITDGKNEDEYANFESLGVIIAPGKEVIKQINKEGIEFKKSITVIASLYTLPENVDVRPINVTFTAEELEAIP